MTTFAKRSATAPSKAIDMADVAMKRIEAAVFSGLPKIYSKNVAFSPADDFLIDWFPDLPWDPTGGKTAATHILTTQRHLEVVRKFDAKFKLKHGSFEETLTDMSNGTGDFAS